jgi:EmrB/QacA subfamily drug resistance transporter
MSRASEGENPAPPVPGGATRIDWASTLTQPVKLTILGAVLLCLFLAALDQTIVATAMPAIVAQFHGIDLLSWVSIGYLLSSTAMVPIYGRLSDFHGRRRVLIAGLLIFLAGSALCGIAGSMVQLIVDRVIQGVGAAAITSTAFAVPADLYPPSERSRYMGFFGASFGLASVVGPWLGGILTDHWSWRWIFYVNLPLGVIALALILARMPKLASGLRHPLDLAGTVLLVASVVPLMLGLSLDPRRRLHGVPLDPALLVLAALATIAFLAVERRARAPVVPLELFANRTFSVVTIASLLFGAAFFAAVLFLSIFMVNVTGVSAAQAGTAIMPLTLGIVAGGIGASAIVHRSHRYKALIVGGFVVMAIGLVLAARMGPATTHAGVVWRMVVIGLGAGPGMPLMSLALQNAVPLKKVGAATASRQFFAQVGQALGAAIFGLVLSTGLTARLEADVHPLIATLPAAAQARLDLAHLRNGATGRDAGVEAEVRAALDETSKTAVAPGAPQQIALAVRGAFAAAITRIYWGATFIALACALIVALGLPELPLRTSNRPEAFEGMEG